MIGKTIASVVIYTFLVMISSEIAFALPPVTPDDICKQGVLKIGVAIDEPSIIPKKKEAKPITPEAGYPPYLIPFYREESPPYKVYAVGFDLDIIDIIRNKFCEGSLPDHHIYYAPYEEMFVRLQLKQVDLIVAAISASTPSEKRRGVAYSLPYNEMGGDAIGLPSETHIADADEKTGCANRLECALCNKYVYFQGDTLGKDKLSYVTGIDRKRLKKLNITAISEGSLDDVLRGAIKNRGAILLDLPTLQFFMSYHPTKGEDSYKELREHWKLLSVKPDAQGDDQYLVMKSGNVIAARLEDEKLLARINAIINTARVNNDLKTVRDKWLGINSQNYNANLAGENKTELMDSGTLPKPYKKNIGFSFNIGTPIFGSEGDQEYGGTLEIGDQWPSSHRFTGWWQKFIHSPLSLGLAPWATEYGISIKVSEAPDVQQNVSVTLKRTASIGPFWRYYFDKEIFFSGKPWFGYKIATVYTKTVDAEKATDTFTEDSNWKGSFIPETGVKFPFSDNVAFEVSAKIEDILMTRGKPEPTLQVNMGVTIGI